MNFNLYACEDGFLVSAECVESPPAARNRHRPRERLGTFPGTALPVVLNGRLMHGVTKEGYVFIGKNDPGFGDIASVTLEQRTPQCLLDSQQGRPA